MAIADLKIRCGDYDLSKDSSKERFEKQDRKVNAITFHPFYDSEELFNDIAIIHTTEAFKKAPNVNTICLPNPERSYSEALCTSMGWGCNSEDCLKNKYQNFMKQVKLKRWTNRTICEDAIRGTKDGQTSWRLDDSWLCASHEQHKSTIDSDNDFMINQQAADDIMCKGDGGGSLVCTENRYVQFLR